jgi:serine/threonine protein kinase
MELAPYGDFWNLILNGKLNKDEVLVRTYFKQLIQGLEYLHTNDVFHSDLKPHNLLLGENYILKISDFDHALLEGDCFVTTGGTDSFRAPEIMKGECLSPTAADIYSAGIILFCMRCGAVPYLEGGLVSGKDVFELMCEKNDLFWKIHKQEKLDKDFKKLFMQMVDKNFELRPSISDIKRNKWFQGPTYSEDELKEIMVKNKDVLSIHQRR